MNKRIMFFAFVAALAVQDVAARAAMQQLQPPMVPEPGGSPQAGTIDDATVNLLKLGMSDTEVFAIAGAPKYPTRELNYSARWIYSLGNDLLEVTFGSGHVIGIKRLNPDLGSVSVR